jgi:2-keto-3-deoxy-L-rhamnonate aldolase RhmA
MQTHTRQFRERLLAGELLCGTFIKTPTCHAIEILGEVGFDFMVIDEEHAPFDRQATDVALLAAKAAGIPALVRVATPSSIGPVLDCGAVGVLVPHVDSAEKARLIARASRFRSGERGFSNSPRAGRYGGLSLSQHIELADALVTVVAQIEDVTALERLDEIAAVDGVDALFVGRGDLAAALGLDSPEMEGVRDAAARTVAAAVGAGKPILFFVSTLEDAAAMRDLGGSSFIFSSDQGLMRAAGQAALRQLRTLR